MFYGESEYSDKFQNLKKNYLGDTGISWELFTNIIE